MKRLLSLALLLNSLSAYSCYESSIVNPQPFMGNNGEVFRLADGSIWVVKYEYQYMYEYYPKITACPEDNLIIVNGKKLNAAPISSVNSYGGGGRVIESKIDGEFEGFEGDTIFKLTNGQIWQQTDGKYKYKYKYRPRVTIISNGNSGKMSIEDIDKTIKVIRLR